MAWLKLAELVSENESYLLHPSTLVIPTNARSPIWWSGGAPGVGVIYAENGWWVNRNWSATTHLDSAFKKHNTNTTILEIRAIRDGQSIQEDKRLYLASRYAKIRDQQLGDCEKQKIYNKNNMLAERTGLSAYGLKVLFILTYGLK